MKTINDYMNIAYKFVIIEDKEEGGFTGYYPELSGCITCADTIEELMVMADDAKREWIENGIKDGIIIPEPPNYSGQFKLRVPKTLHKHLAEKAEMEGVSMNQYCVSILSKYA